MHEHLRLLERVDDQRVHPGLQHLRFAWTQLQRQVSLQQPVGKQAHLEAQQLLVVRRQLPGGRAPRDWICTSAASASAYSGSAWPGLASSGRYIVVPRSVSSRKPSRSERSRTRGRVDADFLQHGRDTQVRTDVFLAGRRIHDDQCRLSRARHTKITAETGVGGGRRDAVLTEAEVPLEPLAQQRETWIVLARDRRERACVVQAGTPNGRVNGQAIVGCGESRAIIITRMTTTRPGSPRLRQALQAVLRQAAACAGSGRRRPRPRTSRRHAVAGAAPAADPRHPPHRRAVLTAAPSRPSSIRASTNCSGPIPTTRRSTSPATPANSAGPAMPN